MSKGYTRHRKNVLKNADFYNRAEIQVSVTCDCSGTEHFQVISVNGWKSANRHVLKRITTTEAENSRPTTRSSPRIEVHNADD
jgi:hypothetical protein